MPDELHTMKNRVVPHIESALKPFGGMVIRVEVVGKLEASSQLGHSASLQERPKAIDKKLSLQNVLRQLLPLCSDWRTIGALLGLPPGKLSEIKEDHIRTFLLNLSHFTLAHTKIYMGVM